MGRAAVNETTAYLGANEVEVRFEFEPACYGHGAHPDSEAYVFITEVGIGGVWISAEYIVPDWLTNTERDILAERGRSLQAEADCAAWERGQEQLMERGYP
jgi:hypothetical protein